MSTTGTGSSNARVIENGIVRWWYFGAQWFIAASTAVVSLQGILECDKIILQADVFKSRIVIHVFIFKGCK